MINKPNTAHGTIEVLASLFPAAFSVFQGRRKPLKVGIREDLIAASALACFIIWPVSQRL